MPILLQIKLIHFQFAFTQSSWTRSIDIFCCGKMSKKLLKLCTARVVEIIQPMCKRSKIIRKDSFHNKQIFISQLGFFSSNIIICFFRRPMTYDNQSHPSHPVRHIALNEPNRPKIDLTQPSMT